MIDLSVQGHFDFELIRITSLRKNACADLFGAALESSELWGYLERMEDEVLADTYDREVELQAEMWASIDTHLALAVVLGCAHSKLFHKFHAAVHCIFLETGSALELQDFCRSIFAFTWGYTTCLQSW